MQPNLFSKIKGYITIELRGERLEELINLAVATRLVLWDIRIIKEQLAEVNLSISDFYRLRPLLKKTGCRLHILHRYGLPFFLDKLGKRKFFVAGVFFFLAGLFLLTSLVWKVEVEGNEKLMTVEILEKAKQLGIYEYQWKFRLKNQEDLARELHNQLPGAAWIGVQVEGTHIRIKVVESASPEEREPMNPRHLVATKNAVVTQILAEKGKPVVQPNQYVREGDVLISGWIGNEANQQTVVSQGQVKGLVWYTSTIETPLVRKYKTYSGNSFKRFYLVFGNRALQLTGYGHKYEASESASSRKTLQWRNYGLPVGWLNEKVREVHLLEEPLEKEAAREIGLERARADLLQEAGKESKIIAEKILKEQEENGKLVMEVHFEVEENIAVEQPIVTVPPEEAAPDQEPGSGPGPVS
ncbi:sporulation protein YqfD [Paenibacillus sp. J2TS4]|uniref:sporulation protein YqfD n=1 Tax=Paenibacillus sp. J2TS4 TaxID=2807194 RepID=UPI001B2ED64D|nr:sporulation protein YqfD [Paenibacillus sp. J2TS4]GIP35831.1 sporulation protein YqfD [Paenibacillus sp. J2TS4]